MFKRNVENKTVFEGNWMVSNLGKDFLKWLLLKRNIFCVMYDDWFTGVDN